MKLENKRKKERFNNSLKKQICVFKYKIKRLYFKLTYFLVLIKIVIYFLKNEFFYQISKTIYLIIKYILKMIRVLFNLTILIS